MHVEKIEIDSEVLGGAVLALADFSLEADFPAFETEYCRAYRPLYVYGKLPLTRLAEIQVLEAQGFQFIECQLETRLRLRKPYPIGSSTYKFERVKDEQTLRDVLEIAGATFIHDRFFLDPALPPAAAGERYRRYVSRSFAAADEEVYRLFDPDTGGTLAFKTHRILDATHALLLLGGVHPEMKQFGLGPLNSYHELNELFANGIRDITSHVSAANLPIVNVEVSKMGYHVMETYAVLRKIYPQKG